jgi:very-short-patch-repair endonuclease
VDAKRTEGALDLRKTARHLRKNLTPEEVKLWVNLKILNKQGYNFRRQAPLDGYILDFAEFTQRLIIEVDGTQHGEREGERKDKIRDAHFKAAGFQVLRFWNIDINTEMDGVIYKILSVLKEPPPPKRAPPP